MSFTEGEVPDGEFSMQIGLKFVLSGGVPQKIPGDPPLSDLASCKMGKSCPITNG